MLFLTAFLREAGAHFRGKAHRHPQNADDQIIAELDAAGNTLREYIYMNDLPVAVIEGGTSLFWVHSDHLNRPVKMLDRNRNSVWEASYEPFGTVHSITGTAANDNRFPGQLFQLETGLAYNWHRHYDATIGRYTQADPLGLTAMLSDGPSLYGYAGQSPQMLYDPTGEGAIGSAIGGAAGGWLGGMAGGAAAGPLGAAGGRSLGSRLGARAGDWLGDWIGDKWSDNVMCSKGGKRGGKGERGHTAKPDGTENPGKKWKDDPNNPGWGWQKDPHTGKRDYKKRPPYLSPPNK